MELFEASAPDAYDMILMYLRTSMMGGLEVTERICRMNRPDAAQILIVAMTADAFVGNVNDTGAAGMNAAR